MYAQIDKSSGVYMGAISMSDGALSDQRVNYPQYVFLPVPSNPLIQTEGLYELDLNVFRLALYAQIDKDAGAFRARFITDVPGQAQTYEKKEREAS